MNFRLSGVILTSLLLVGCASSKESAPPQRSDPFEGFNRSMFNFNYYVLDPYLVRPAAVVWRDYLPQPARNGLDNFFTNLAEPAAMINYFIEGNPYRAMVHFNRFFLNTLLGMGGFIDVASMANPKLAKDEPLRFGSTLGYYDVGYGPYIVLPGYGSATIREDGGDVVDTLYPPLSYLTFWMSAGKWVLEGLESRAQLLDSDGLLRNSSDPYLVVRDAYFQHNNFLANDGKFTPQVNPNAKSIESSLSEIDSGK
ncbi:phospholipid-binding lipoprotein MlaA [Pectobacteriaceae bacterium CE90]|uniref:phospholipid-binding lipoprotein MlaA n=1 Tax=Brenneria uluponensis TaxID=3057057 RepID=UPI0028E28BED|nr:phospholipid-binding lipoprotein MlaA [Brenneria ulupoensis]WJY16395.1 phospholipid-binding lipoprotein MlaA [Pectobacteriaceae bacterium CE90]